MSPSPVMTKRLKELKYFSPTTVEEAISVLEEYDGRVKVLAGGTDLLPLMKLRAVTPECIVSLKKMVGLDYVREEGKELRIGALTTIATILASDLIKRQCFSLYEAAAGFATPQVRNMATIGGNICRSSPSADTVPPLMSFGAELKLVGARGERKVLLEDFFTGAGQNVLDREVLTEIVVPLGGEQYGTAFAKLTRNSVDLAKVNCAVRITVSGGRCDDIRIVLGAVADRAVRAKKTEQAIKDKEIKDEVIEGAAQKVIEDIAPITDVRSTAEYRAQVSQVLVKRVIKQAIDRAK
jgi:carbon-monoxide dehydrogenase medium subunit